MKKPKLVYSSWSSRSVNVDKKELNKFIDDYPWFSGDLAGKTVYLESKSISQDKLRNAGFTITRSKDKADIILIKNPIELSYKVYDDQVKFNCEYNAGGKQKSSTISDYLDTLIADNSNKLVLNIHLYKYLYKYEGNLQLCNDLEALFNSNDQNNFQMAMEMMTNANWEGNEIYCYHLLNKYQSNLHFSYKNSVSWKGFIKSLVVDPFNLGLYNAFNYKEFCKNSEHFTFVDNIYKGKFKEELDALTEQYNIKIDKLEYSINMN